MNTRKLFVVMMVVCLPVVLLAALPAPTGLSVNNTDPIELTWNIVTDPDTLEDAAKYSVDIYGIVTYTNEELEEVTGEVEVSFGTSDRTDGLDMADPSLTITLEELATAIAAQLGIAVEDLDLVSLDGEVKVKALDPGKDKGPQNNPFSDPVDLDVTF